MAGVFCASARGLPMSKSLSIVVALAIGLSAASGAAFAAPCKDAKGKFIKCPAPAAARCRDKTSKAFAKCGAPNTEPVPMTAAKAPMKK